MLPGDPETRCETPGERKQRQAEFGLDRRGLKQVVIGLTVIWGGMAALVAADVVGVDRRMTSAMVVGFADRWNKKGGHECVTQLLTAYGEAHIYTRNLCQYASWHIGDKAEVEARQLRFTRTIVVSTRGTIFDGAYSMLPE